MRLIFDIETNGLLLELTKTWMLVFIDMDTGHEYIFCDQAHEFPELVPDNVDPKAGFNAICADVNDPLPRTVERVASIKNGAGITLCPTNSFSKFIDDCAETGNLQIWGHFILGFDFTALEKVYGYKRPKNIRVFDSMVLSQVLNYKRFGMRGHSLAVWGESLGYPKVEHEDWTQFSWEMLFRCRGDVRLNLKVVNSLLKEFKTFSAGKPLLGKSIRVEQDVLEFCSQAEKIGWLFDKDGAVRLLAELKAEMDRIESVIVPMLDVQTEIIDAEPQQPKWVRDGTYAVVTAKRFDIPREWGHPEVVDMAPMAVLGPYQRFQYVHPDLGSLPSVKGLLDRLGWVPDDWNWKRGPNGEPIKVSPKLTTTSLTPLGEVGVMLDKYYTLRSRHQIVSGWVESVEKTGDGRLHGSCFPIATPTGRARHSGLVNVPSADEKVLYGVEIRKLFITKPGWKICGADSSGNQMRAFCHYLGNEAYTNEVIDGDVHSANMRVLQEVVPTTTRSIAKPFLYAFLFGGGAEKLALILTGKRDAKIGKRAKDIFTSKVPGLKELIARITKAYDATKLKGEPWIPAIDGRRIFIDSPHKALNYLLQSCEAVTCKAAVHVFMEAMSTKHPHIPWNPLIFYHDEFEVETPEEYAEIVSAEMKSAFKEAPKIFGVTIMDGESKIGNSWYEVH